LYYGINKLRSCSFEEYKNEGCESKKMSHFETLWNEAESFSKTFGDSNGRRIFLELKDLINDLPLAELDNGNHSEIIGKILFGLCEYCTFLEVKKGKVVNSYESLEKELANRRNGLPT
jgi:hypothetical protein